MCFLPLVRLWLWVSVFASVAGWTLSALGQLNRTGYLIAFGIGFSGLWAAHTQLGLGLDARSFGWRKMLRRFRRPLPLCFAVLSCLILLGDLLYPPSNYTALTYHIPRVLHWLAAGQWHWIHTPDSRMNYSGVAFEWLSAPMLLFLKSDRALFLLNYFPYLLLPGLVFSVFKRLGIRSRVAWQWMWLLPMGYNYLLQAGSAANDSISAVYALAAMDFGCRAWQSRRPVDLWYSLLAVALMVGTKPTSLPLLLPWVILIFPLLPRLRTQKLATALVLGLAVLASFFPLALLNHWHCGDWLGNSVEVSRLKMANPVIGVLGNTVELALDNFVPPFFPAAGWWNQYCLTLLPPSWIASFQVGFFALGEMPTEDWAGVGFGVSVLATILALGSLVAGRRQKKGGKPASFVPATIRFWVMVTPWIALLVYGAKAGMATPARLIAPYYPLLLPLLFAGAGAAVISRRVWWRGLVAGVVLLAFGVLMVSPDRPLWPARTVLTHLQKQHPDQHAIARALTVYTIYSQRADALAGVRDLIPPEAKTVGFIGTEDDMEISLWRPYGGRRVADILLADSPEQIRQQVQYVVLGGYLLKTHDLTIEAWLKQSGADLVAATNAMLKVSEGSQPWYVVRFKPLPDHGTARE